MDSEDKNSGQRIDPQGDQSREVKPQVIDVDSGSGVVDDDSDNEVEIVQVKPSTQPASAQTWPWQPVFFTPYFFERKSHCTPTWKDMHFDCCDMHQMQQVAPSTSRTQDSSETHFYKFHLLSQSDFSISNVSRNSNRGSMQRLGAKIRKIARENATKAVFDNGIWRIPIAIYQPLFTALSSDPTTFVEGIPPAQLKIVALARAAAQTTESSPNQLIHLGVPEYLATALAPYQRAGVDFILQRQGRALLADEMGLGKSIQSIAAMCCYRAQWPLLVICPSSATHHWQAEFMEWLSYKQDSNLQQPCQAMKRKRINDDHYTQEGRDFFSETNDYNGLHNEKSITPLKVTYISSREILIVSSSKTNIRADPNIHIVICSYGFASKMVAIGTLLPGMFQCIIADESHLLKNKSSVRTKNILPILQGANRLILLSGTPALSRPIELYPQISAIGDMKLLWRNEDDYVQKYCKGLTMTSLGDETRTVTTQGPNDTEGMDRNPSLAELHTLLTSTIMLRRRKMDILKYLPPKNRQRVMTVTRDPTLKQQIMDAMATLTKGKGVLASMAKSHSISESSGISEAVPTERKAVLNHLFCLAGMAKIPLLIELLNKFIMDPSKGKLCIFAHHTAVLDALIHQSKLSDNNNMCRYIRIDGSTIPKDRQERSQAFQSNPLIRIAILSITSAGVALTLTASSTVWFAELYWTPAMLLQAEDRCHRIGQQTAVRCVYFVVRESLDELLWKLIQKKYAELGEFVEGQDNQNMIVHSNYNDENEAIKSWFTDDPCIKSPFDFTDDEDIRRCIEELARDDTEVDQNNGETEKMPIVLNSAASSDEIIDLIDISDRPGTESSYLSRNYTIQNIVCSENCLKEIYSVLPQALMPELRLYRFYFPRSFDLVAGLQLICGRLMNTRSYADASGNEGRPGVGDVIVGFQGRIFGVVRHGEHALKVLSIIKGTFQSQPYIEVIFGEGENSYRYQQIWIQAYIMSKSLTLPGKSDQSCRSLLETYNKHINASQHSISSFSPAIDEPAIACRNG